MPEAHICLMCGRLATQLRRGRCVRCYGGHPGAEYRRNRDASLRNGWVATAGSARGDLDRERLALAPVGAVFAMLTTSAIDASVPVLLAGTLIDRPVADASTVTLELGHALASDDVTVPKAADVNRTAYGFGLVTVKWTSPSLNPG
jgi:hypothetical protein